MRRLICVVCASLILLSACQSESNTSSMLMADSSSQTINGTPSESDISTIWNPTADNTVYSISGDFSEEIIEASYQRLEEWVDAYRTGEYCQIYYEDQRLPMTIVWRLTCNGSGTYTIELKPNAEDEYRSYQSTTITEGVTYYIFGEDVQGDNPVFWPLPIWKGAPDIFELSVETEWEQQATITAMQAEERIMNNRQGESAVSCVVKDRFLLLGQCFYSADIIDGSGTPQEAVAISADETVILDISMIDGTLSLNSDTASWTVKPGDEKVDIDQFWAEKRKASPYLAPGFKEYLRGKDNVSEPLWENLVADPINSPLWPKERFCPKDRGNWK